MKKPRNWKRPLAISLALAVLIATGHVLRSQLGIEFSVESMRTWVGDLGALGPIVFLALFASRQFLLLPSLLLIPVAGLCFGLVAGTLLATLGLFVNAVGLFLATRFGVHRGVETRQPKQKGLVARIEAAGPWLIGGIVAHPAGPLTSGSIGAGLSTMSLSAFAGVTLLAGFFRCLLWAFLGSTLVDFGSAESLLATVILAAALLLPLIYRSAQKRSALAEAGIENEDLAGPDRPRPATESAA